MRFNAPGSMKSSLSSRNRCGDELLFAPTFQCSPTSRNCRNACQRRKRLLSFRVSVLFNEPKLLKSSARRSRTRKRLRFSALQRAEIAEIGPCSAKPPGASHVSVLFNEPKLLKFIVCNQVNQQIDRFSALQRAEIAEMLPRRAARVRTGVFQCSSTSRNC